MVDVITRAGAFKLIKMELVNLGGEGLRGSAFMMVLVHSRAAAQAQGIEIGKTDYLVSVCNKIYTWNFAFGEGVEESTR